MEPEKSKAIRLGRVQKSIVDTLKNGGTLHRFFENGHTVYTLNDHKEVPEGSVKGLISKGLISENSDAMFGVGQTYQLKGPQ